MRTRTLLPLALTASVLLGACSAAATPAPTAPPTAAPSAAPSAPVTPAPVTPAPTATPAPAPTAVPAPSNPTGGFEGRTFLSVKVDGHTLVAGSTITFNVNGGQLGVSAGCNSMGAPFTVVDGKLKVGQMMSTMMACDPALMAQDTWLAAFLEGATIALDDIQLTLTKDGTTITLKDNAALNPPKAIEGTTWVLDSIIVGGDAVSSVPAGVTATIMIAGGKVQVAAGCNRGSGTATVNGDTITFGPIATTKMACDQDRMSVEETVLGVLTGDVPFSLDGQSLTLRGAANGLGFKAQP